MLSGVLRLNKDRIRDLSLAIENFTLRGGRCRWNAVSRVVWLGQFPAPERIR